MEWEEMMAELKAGLTGHWETDAAYLLEACRQYEGHPMEKEIIRRIGELATAILPKEKKDELLKRNEEERIKERQLIQTVSRLLRDDQGDQARVLLEEKIAAISGLFAEDAHTIYLSFHSLFERYLYLYLFQPDKQIEQTAYDYSSIYRIYGEILTEFNQMEQALTAFQTAVVWNPVDPAVYFSLSKCYRRMHKWEQAKKTAADCLQYTCTREGLARCYRDLAACFRQEKRPVDAACLYFLSSAYQPTETADRALGELIAEAGDQVSRLTADKVKARVERLDIPIGPAEHIFTVAEELYNFMEENGQDSSAIEDMVDELLGK